MSDINQLIIEQSIAHWPVFAGVGVMLFAAWKWLIPNSVKTSLENGGGDAVRVIIKSELHDQDVRMDEKIEQQNEKLEAKIKEANDDNKERILQMMTKHEELERVTLQNVIMKVKNDNDAHHTTLTDKLEDIDERTTHIERKLKMKRRSAARSEGK